MKPYQTILAALAGRGDEASVIHEAIRLADGLDADLVFLHVNDPTAGQISMMMEAVPLVTEDDLRAQVRALGYPKRADALRVDIITSANLTGAIAEATQTADLVVLGHRQKNRFLSALTDAADKNLADLAACPVVIVPAG